MATTTQKIRNLNDELRRHLVGGLAVMTPGIAALGPAAVDRIVKSVAAFDDFHRANDPHQEHDFGAFDADGVQVLFKIDYFDRRMTGHSPDPADPADQLNASSPSCWRRSIELLTTIEVGLRLQFPFDRVRISDGHLQSSARIARPSDAPIG